MRKLFLYLVLFSTLLISCEKEEVIEEEEVISNCENQHFYFDRDIVVNLDTLLDKNHLLIGFENSYSFQQIKDLLTSESGINHEFLFYIGPSENYALAAIKFTKSKPCSELLENIKNLNKFQEISFSTFTYRSKYCIEIECDDLMSSANEFSVKLNDANNIENLDDLLLKTNTWKRKSGENRFIISSDKNSTGNVIELSRLFYETGLFEYCLPAKFIFRKKTFANKPQ